jgi:putative endopeptidase
MCHGFDDDGKEFNANGEKKKWWTRGDKFRYKQKSKALIHLFDKQKIFHKHINGEKTLSENIADLGGVAVALEALKIDMESRGVRGITDLQEYRDFFQAFAVSWRTLYRKEKLESSVDLDSHAPAFLRVNLVVSQFQEWYDAFRIDESSSMYIPPEKRIKIF